MNKENTNKLKEDFPHLYLNLREGEFECMDGWFDLIYELSKRLDEVIKGNEKLFDKEDFLVVKEKFGGLRFQGWDTHQITHEIINEYEQKSYTICEKCGNSGRLRKLSGFLQTLCDAEFAAKQFSAILK